MDAVWVPVLCRPEWNIKCEGQKECAMDRLAVSIRPYQPHDCPEMIRLFRDTVCTVNAADYTRPQIDAWIGARTGRIELPGTVRFGRTTRLLRCWASRSSALAIWMPPVISIGCMSTAPINAVVSLPPCAMCWKHRLRRQRSLPMRRSRQGLFLKDAATVSSGPSRSNAMAFCSQTS